MVPVAGGRSLAYVPVPLLPGGRARAERDRDGESRRAARSTWRAGGSAGRSMREAASGRGRW